MPLQCPMVGRFSKISSALFLRMVKPRSCRFEPSIDYVVTRIPRFAFEKFPQANRGRGQSRALTLPTGRTTISNEEILL